MLYHLRVAVLALSAAIRLHLACSLNAPLALHLLIPVAPSGDAVIRLRGYELLGLALTANISSLTQGAQLYQLSQVYNSYGYDPKKGEVISLVSTGGTRVTGKDNRVYYKRPQSDAEKWGMWDVFTYTVTISVQTAASTSTATSLAAIVTLVPPSGAIFGSDFLTSNDGWTVVGNRWEATAAVYDSSSRGIVNQYVYGFDDIIDVSWSGAIDKALWYFSAPSSYASHLGISYGGTLEFALAAFAGNFTHLGNNSNVNMRTQYGDDVALVLLECSACSFNKGVQLGFPLSRYSFNGLSQSYVLPLTETSGWLKNPKNVLNMWRKPSKCEMIQVLSGLSSLMILGDITRWYETVALDNVIFRNTHKQSQIPICAQGRPDASVCTC